MDDQELKIKPETKNFYLTIYELIKQGKGPKQISLSFGISLQRINYYLSSLKKQGLIKKLGYGTWEATSKKEVKIMPKDTLHTTPSEFTSLKPDMVRGHAFIFTLKLPKITNWEKRTEWLEKKQIPFKKVGFNGINQSIKFRQNKIWLTPKSIVVYFPSWKSRIAETGRDAQKYAIYDFLKVIKGLENLMNCSFGKELKFKVSRQHYALIKNALAKQYDNEGKKLIVSDAGGGWLLIDNSYNLHELETIHKDTAVSDNEKVQNFFNSLKQYPITTDFILNAFAQTSEIQKEEAQKWQFYSKTIEKHVWAIETLGKEVKGLGKAVLEVKREKRKIKETKEQKKLNDYI